MYTYYNPKGAVLVQQSEPISEHYAMYSYSVYNQPIASWDRWTDNRSINAYDDYGYQSEAYDISRDIRNVYTNDVNGNRKRLEVKDGSTVTMTADYTYDVLDRLRTVTSDDGVNASYVYDTQNRRISKTVNGATTNHIWDGDNIIREKDATAETARYYRAAHLVASKQNGTVNTYQYDPHGSVTKFGNTEYHYDAFGNQLTDTDATNPFRYCGEYFDEETGFIYLRNRYYDTTTGRFITEDPAKDGLNWYVYCANNPVNRWDPTGYVWSEEDERNYQNLVTYGFYEKAMQLKSVVENATIMYEAAMNKGDYIEMNMAAKMAADARADCYLGGYADSFDYTHEGKIYQYVYSSKKYSGCVYIVKMTEEESLSQSVGENDFVVRDRRDENNPAMEIMYCNKSKNKAQRIAVLEVLALYEKKNPSAWKRDDDIEKMEDEWWMHIAFGIGPLKDNGEHAHIDNRCSGVLPMP